ncbi:hypothetical protein PR048_026914 [Dryococelus australis]|uniref:Uncharacterized protein n=1 Tax=Dryococelus australis TaxID=614101 RepID=A0ABQ9GMN5_9NEOP|nr:hypothetical protein PR048_026914 [Dryococelus australis]
MLSKVKRLQTTLPVMPTSLEPQCNPSTLQSMQHGDGLLKGQSKQNYDKWHGAKDLEPLKLCTLVCVQI